MAAKSSILNNYKIKDPVIKEVMKRIEEKADTQKSVKTITEGINYANLNKVEENKIHIDPKNNTLTVRVGDDLFDLNMIKRAK